MIVLPQVMTVLVDGLNGLIHSLLSQKGCPHLGHATSLSLGGGASGGWTSDFISSSAVGDGDGGTSVSGVVVVVGVVNCFCTVVQKYKYGNFQQFVHRLRSLSVPVTIFSFSKRISHLA